tara:strand:+ start:372 stop:740 length:369 start_codon:yes stop_codon:yes gene_type:complete
MSNSSQSPGEKPSSEVTTTPLEDEGPTLEYGISFEEDIPQAKHFPVITIVLSLDDPSEPNHVDLGTVPPQIASASLFSIASQLKKLSWPSRVTYAGQTVFDPAQMLPDLDDDDPEEDFEEPL